MTAEQPHSPDAETFLTLLRAARQKEELKCPDDEVISAYIEAAAACPTRAEALHGAARYCRDKSLNQRGYEFATQGLAVPYPHNAPAVEDWIYEYGLLDELAVNAYWTERYQDCLDACLRLLHEGKMPSNMRGRVRKNAEFAAEKIRLQPRSRPLAAVTTVSVIIPSRLARVADSKERLFLEDAVDSIRQQSMIERYQVQILVGVDTGTIVPADLAQRLGIEFVDSGGHSQTAALNAAANRAEGECLAILEDDDMWDRMFLRTAFDALSKAEFLSSTQLELDENGEVLRINDFPTPCGWVMRREAFQAIGGFDESYRWHIEHDWLGRLGETSLSRVHLVESTAPIVPHLVEQMRPWLHNLLRLGKPAVDLVRHAYPIPLIVRRIHSNSLMRRTPQEGSKKEIARLVQTYGRIPW